ncbi:MAG: neutral zinc metallopeptidase [Beijerinckiaceae bacterium]|jgi:predicted metalloprotease
MEWENFRRSDNIEDRRGDDSGGGDTGGGFGGATGGLGIGAIIILGLISWALGIDPRVLIGGAEMANNARHSNQYSQTVQPQRQAQHASGTPKDAMGQFVAAVLAETEDVWTDILPAQKNIQYIKPKLVLFSGQTRSGCGAAQSAMGPFYCPADKKIYLDLSFFNDMKRKLGGGGDFAYAYVIAHEVGHHIQDQLGILGKAEAAEQRASKAQANAISVRIELMADCLAGVWAANADEKYHVLQPGDVEKAINTAKAIGDDRLEQAAGQRVVPDSFTHGTSAQRVQWLNTGLHSGQIDSCSTFAR